MKLASMSRLATLSLVMVGGVVATHSTRAGVIIPLSSSAGPVPSGSGTGLNGFSYAFPDTFDNLRTLEQADAFIASNSPAATFRATEINYPRPGGNTDTLGDLLGPDAATLDPPSLASAARLPVYSFRGFIAITADFDIDPTNGYIDVEFAMGSDDASRLRIGGVDVLRLAGDDPDDERGVYDANDFRTIARFEGAGLYPVEIVWWDWYGGIGIQWYSSIPGLPRDGMPEGLGGIVPTSVLYAVPEPSTFASAALGLAGLAGYAGWRRVRSGAKSKE